MLMVGTDEWAQVVNDHARAERVSSTKSMGTKRVDTREGQGEGEPSGPASKASSGADCREKKTAAVCDQPPGLDELAGHIQATIMPDLWAPGSLPSSNSEVSSLAPLNQGSFVFPGKARGARPRSTMRAQDNAATLEEMLSLFVEAIGMDKGSLTLPLGWRSVKMRRR